MKRMIKIKDIVAAVNEGIEITSQPMPGVAAFVIAKLFDEIKKEYTLFEKVRDNIVKKINIKKLNEQCETLKTQTLNPDSQARISAKEKLKSALIELEKSKSDFTKELTLVMDHTVEITSPLIQKNMIEELTLSPKCIMALDCFIEAN